MRGAGDVTESAAEGADPPPPTLTRGERALCAIAALAAIGTGGTAVFQTDNEVGTGTLLVLGAYFVIAAILGRFPRMKFGENKIDPSEVRRATRKSETAIRQAREARAEAEEARAEAGDVKDGYALRAEAPIEQWATRYSHQVDSGIAGLAAQYQAVRTTMSKSSDRSEKMTAIIGEMIATWKDPAIGDFDYRGLLEDPDRGLQLAGIAYVHARPEAAAVQPVATVALTPDKAFSEHWAAKALRLVLRDHCELLDPSLRARVKTRLAQVPPGTDRARELHGILSDCP